MAALFQAAMDGDVPKGCKGTLAGEFNLQWDNLHQEAPITNVKKIAILSRSNRFWFRFPTNRVYCTGPTRYANPGDTLVSVRAPVGDINMAAEYCALGRGVAAVRHKSGSGTFTYYGMEAFRANLTNLKLKVLRSV